VSTRGAVLFEEGDGCYRAFYNHCDSYPTWLGVELAELLRQGKRAGEIIAELELEDYEKIIGKRATFNGFGEEVAKQAFQFQGDLEWVYLVDFSPPSLQIFRTSNPDLIHGLDFVFGVWFSYVQYFPEDIKGKMAEVQRTAGITLNGLAAYHRANEKSGA